MKRMILMTLVLSVMAVGSASANDAVNDRGPKKRGVVVTVCADPLLDLIFGNPHHDCCHHHMHKPKHHPKHHGHDRVDGRHHGGRDKFHGDRHDAPHKGDRRDNHKDYGPRGHGRR